MAPLVATALGFLVLGGVRYKRLGGCAAVATGGGVFDAEQGAL